MRIAILLPFALTLTLAAAMPVHAQPQQRAEVGAAAQRLQDKVVAWRRDIHAHPELGNREFRTAALVAEHLRALGLEPTTGVAHTGVTAVLKGGRPGPRIAIRADMDALPVTEQTDVPFASKVTTEYRGQTTGVMHACGHDAHVAILMGVAEAMAGMRAELPGEVLFVFQPAEEGAPEGEEGGAELMLKEGVFARFRPDAVFGLHVGAALNADKLGVRPGPIMAASDSFSITVHGRQAHGSRPWQSIDPIVTAAQIINAAQTIVSRNVNLIQQPAVLTFGAINGGIRSNIIPDSVEMIGTIRTFDDDMRAQILARLTTIAEQTASANGATVTTRIPEPGSYPVTVNDPDLATRMRPSLEAVAGSEHVVTVPVTTGAEDFSFFAREVPGLFFNVGTTPVGQDPAKAPTNHSPLFYVDESALDLGFRAMLQVTLDYLHGGAD